MRPLRSLVAAFIALACASAQAQDTLEVIPLRHRSVDQVLPALRPLLEPGGVLTGRSNQIIVRSSARNLAEIRSALDAIDTPARRLVISVRFDDRQGAGRQAIEATGTVRSDNVTISNEPVPHARSRVRVLAGSAGSSIEERVDQRVQVLEGGHAYISMESSGPVVDDLGTGFELVPHVSGGNVVLDIDLRRDTPGARPGELSRARMASSVGGRLGEWFEIGGAVQSASRDERGILYSGNARAGGARAIWVKVEEIRP